MSGPGGRPIVPGTKRCPKVILEGTRMTHKTDLAFALNEHPRMMGPRKYRYHGPLVSAEWSTFTAEPWGHGLIDYAPEQEALAMETYRTWLHLMQLQRHYSWVVDRFHVSTIHYQETHGRTVDLDWLDAGLAELGFRLLLCTRRPGTFAAAREERLKVSGMPSQYDDVDRFAREQERFRELCASSWMPVLELDITDGDLDAACVQTAEWLETTDAMWCR